MNTAAIVDYHEDLVVYIASLNESDRRASDLLAPLSEAQANWQSHAGAAWSVAQCMDHMAATNRTYLAALVGAAPRAKSGHRPFAPAGFLSRFYLKKTEPPASVKIKAPAKIQPAPQITKADALARFKQSNDDVRDFVRQTAQLNLCATRFKNPFIPGLNFTIATGLLGIAAHNRRHLWQAEQVLKKADFPRS